MKDNSKSIPKINTFKVPSHIFFIGKVLQFFSSNLAANYVLKLFATPPKFNTPEREEMMRESAKKIMVTIPSIKKEVMVYEYGYSKQKVLLAHGWAGRGTQLYEIADKILENRMMVVSFDAPAHGLSEGKTSSLPEYVATINYINEEFGPFEAAIGHSFGSITLLASLSKNPFVKKLVVIGIDSSINKIVDDFVKKLKLKQKVADKLKRKMNNRFKTGIETNSPNETAKKVNIPTLVLHDTQDIDVDVSSAFRIRQNLSKSELLITSGLGHRRILRDKKVIQKIIDFIKD